jgi:hypothetical protein
MGRLINVHLKHDHDAVSPFSLLINCLLMVVAAVEPIMDWRLNWDTDIHSSLWIVSKLLDVVVEKEDEDGTVINSLPHHVASNRPRRRMAANAAISAGVQCVCH